MPQEFTESDFSIEMDEVQIVDTYYGRLVHSIWLPDGYSTATAKARQLNQAEGFKRFFVVVIWAKS